MGGTLSAFTTLCGNYTHVWMILSTLPSVPSIFTVPCSLPGLTVNFYHNIKFLNPHSLVPTEMVQGTQRTYTCQFSHRWKTDSTGQTEEIVGIFRNSSKIFEVYQYWTWGIGSRLKNVMDPTKCTRVSILVMPTRKLTICLLVLRIHMDKDMPHH